MAPSPVYLTPIAPPVVVLTPGGAGPVDLDVIPPTSVALDPTLGTLGNQGIQGVPGPPGSGGDLNSVFTQSIASATWIIPVPAPFISVGKVPSVTVVDSAGTVVLGSVAHNASLNQLTISFSAPFSGSAFLN